MRIDISLPKEWSELSSDQVVFVAKLLTEQLPKYEFITACFLEFAQWKVVKNKSTLTYTFKQGKRKFDISAEVFQGLCSQLNWLVEDVGICANPVTIGKAKGCDIELDDVTLEQYIYTDVYYKAFAFTSDKKYIAMMVACLYFKKNETFNADDIESKRYKYFLKYPAHLQAILMWYTGVKLMLKEKFPELFSTNTNATVGDFDPQMMFLNTLSALNGGRVADNPKVLQSPCIEALHELNQINKRANKLKKK